MVGNEKNKKKRKITYTRTIEKVDSFQHSATFPIK